MTNRIGLAYVVLRCVDLERSRAFYEALGFDLVLEQHGTGARHYACDLGGIVVELYPTSVPQSSNVRLGLRVPNTREVLNALTKLGANIVRVDASETHALVRDADGHEISLQNSSTESVT